MASRIIHIDVEFGPALRASLRALDASLQAADLVQRTHPFEATVIRDECERLRKILSDLMPTCAPNAS